jgi:CDP-6-deoxy-D-xylo-4-hexulose-3-dehydrase
MRVVEMYPLASTTWDEEEILAVNDLLRSGRLTLGAEVKEFERLFADYIGTKYAVMFNSGSSANLGILATLRYLRSGGLKPGDHVIVPAVSWSTTYFPVSQLGFVLDFVDVDPNTLNINVEGVARSITSKTKAIFAVNLLGNAANLVELADLAKTHGLILIEDNCESLGASIGGKMAGSFGLMGSHSSYFSHHICTIEGGMVTTDSRECMEVLTSVRSHGWTRGLEKDNSVHPLSQNAWEDLFRFVLPGYNLRPMELSGSIGKIQLRKFPSFLKERRRNAEVFKSLFHDSLNYRVQTEHGESSWFGFSIILQGRLLGKRSELVEYLTRFEVESRPIVAGNFTRNPVMSHLESNTLPLLPVADEVHYQGLFIGNHHVNFEKEIRKIHQLLVEFENLHQGA